MTPSEIEVVFNEILHKETKHGETLQAKVSGLSRNTVFNWRKGKTKPSLGDMLHVLYELDEIIIERINGTKPI